MKHKALSQIVQSSMHAIIHHHVAVAVKAITHGHVTADVGCCHWDAGNHQRYSNLQFRAAYKLHTVRWLKLSGG
eukprot:362969-Chlamydomonas_euryale.AAC.4